MRIAVVANTSWYLLNFRLTLLQSLQHDGHEVIAVAPRDDYTVQLEQAGLRCAHVAISGDGTHPLRELRSVLALRRLLHRLAVDVVLSHTPKGNLYTALACLGSPRAYIPNVSGLGRVFIRRTLLTRVVLLLYRLTFRHAARVMFQNRDDLESFVQAGLVPRPLCERIPGSGVDLTRFQPAPWPADPAAGPAAGPVFLLVARMLWDKGVGEFVQAARSLKRDHPQARFWLLGFLDVANPAAISRAQMQAWVDEGSVDYLGSTNDVRPWLAQAHCVVLPSSYREGMPRSLLEAAACARPVITTDAPGCRDALIDGVSGWLCRPKDAADLERRMADFIALPSAQRQAAGQAGRLMAEQSFDEQIVIRSYRAAIERLGRPPGLPADAAGVTKRS
jgi:glycosyltransferase involved in cell wall biosynthesis